MVCVCVLTMDAIYVGGGTHGEDAVVIDDLWLVCAVLVRQINNNTWSRAVYGAQDCYIAKISTRYSSIKRCSSPQYVSVSEH